jgi:hypothetical protein
MRSLLQFSAGVLALAVAARLLLPSRIVLAFGSERIVRALGINHVASWPGWRSGRLFLL